MAVHTINVVLIGKRGVGKSCWIKRLTTGLFDRRYVLPRGQSRSPFNVERTRYDYTNAIGKKFVFNLLELDDVHIASVHVFTSVMTKIRPDAIILMCASDSLNSMYTVRECQRLLSKYHADIPRLVCQTKAGIVGRVEDAINVDCKMDLRNGVNVHRPLDLIWESIRYRRTAMPLKRICVIKMTTDFKHIFETDEDARHMLTIAQC